MTHDELKKALFNRRQVIWNSPSIGDLIYERVSAIIYRINEENKIVITAEIADKCGRSVSVVEPARLRYKED